MTRPIVLLLAGCGMLAGLPPDGASPPEDPLLKDFNTRVSGYVKLHQQVQDEIHRVKPTNSSEVIVEHKHRLGHAIRRMRQSAKPGDIFTPEISAMFRQLIAVAMQGSEATRIRESLKHAEPVHLPALRVNHEYPKRIPLQSTPPSLLSNLPKLPPQVEYRLVGHTLVLRDVDANLIVDFMPNAIS